MNLKDLLLGKGIRSTIIRKLINYFPLFNRIICSKNNEIHNNGLLIHSSIRIKGNGNRILIGEESILRNTKIIVLGNDNNLQIGSNNSITSGEFYIEDSHGSIFIGDRTGISGKTHLASIEGERIIIGNDCLFSSNIDIRVGDSHSILNEHGKRINQSESVVIGNHVWVGKNVSIVKGSLISDNTIIGTGSVITKKFNSEGVVIAGNPGKIVKQNVNWCRERI